MCDKREREYVLEKERGTKKMWLIRYRERVEFERVETEGRAKDSVANFFEVRKTNSSCWENQIKTIFLMTKPILKPDKNLG